MSGTVLENVLVREYLRGLSLECITLPVAQARELREQIAAHLDEALAPDATDAEVQAELARLGSPRSLAAAAAGPVRPAGWRRLRNWLGHVRWWVWAAIAVLVPALGTWPGFLISMNSAAPLYVVGTGWLYPADQARAVSTTAGTNMATTVPTRHGQRQGIQFSVVNNSDWTQVILGADPRWGLLIFSDVQVDVESGPHLNQVGDPITGGKSYVSPGVIPPHSFRWVRVSWTSEICPVVNGGENITTDILLRVRVGVISRTEDVSFNQAFVVTGGGPSPTCP
jgi:hypothetical protein